MSIESVLEEITALRNDIKTLSKIVRKVKAKRTSEPQSNLHNENSYLQTCTATNSHFALTSLQL